MEQTCDPRLRRPSKGVNPGSVEPLPRFFPGDFTTTGNTRKLRAATHCQSFVLASRALMTVASPFGAFGRTFNTSGISGRSSASVLLVASRTITAIARPAHLGSGPSIVANQLAFQPAGQALVKQDAHGRTGLPWLAPAQRSPVPSDTVGKSSRNSDNGWPASM